LWQKKIKSMQQQQEEVQINQQARANNLFDKDNNNTSIDHGVHNGDDNSLSLTTNTLDSASDIVLKQHEQNGFYPPIQSDFGDGSVDNEYGGQLLDRKRNGNIQESIQSLKNLQSSTVIPPKELEKLLQRIEYLENLVLSQNKAAMKNKHTSKRKESKSDHISRSKSDRQPENPIYNDAPKRKGSNPRSRREMAAYNEHKHDNDSNSDSASLNKHTANNRYYIIRPMKAEPYNDRRDDRIIDRIVEEHDSNNIRKHRPSSAPATRRSSHSNVGHRLYSAALNQQQQHAMEESARKRAAAHSPPASPRVQKVWVVGHSNSGIHQMQQQHQKPLRDHHTNSNNNNFNSGEPYTYDMKSGRRIPLSEAECQAEERRRKKEAVGHIKALTEMDEELMGSGSPTNNNAQRNADFNSGPTRAEWPGKSTGRSVEEWLQKMKKIRAETEGDKGNNSEQLPTAKFYGAYQKLQKTDLVISVEHCWNCEHHKVSLRHDPAQYVSMADSFLKNLAQVAHSSGIKARVGVCRFRADVTPKSKPSDIDSRIGSCEIQVAYRTVKGDTVTEMLHSKLVSQRWPSKSVAEKRLRSFLSKLDIPTYDSLLPPSIAPVQNSENSNENSALGYPVGLCEWKDTPLFLDDWTFTPPKGGASLNVQWVFDYRSAEEIELPKCPIGSMVYVTGIEFKFQPKETSIPSHSPAFMSVTRMERYPLLGVIKDYVTRPNGIFIKVKIKYVSDEIEVTESQCILSDEYEGQDCVFSSISEVPAAIDILLHLAKQLDILYWDVDENAGDNEDISRNEIYLSRTSFFNQVRKLSWKVEALIAVPGRTIFKHPLCEDCADIQLSYSDQVIQWIFEKYGRLANITAFEKAVMQSYSKPVMKNKTNISEKEYESKDLVLTASLTSIPSTEVAALMSSDKADMKDSDSAAYKDELGDSRDVKAEELRRKGSIKLKNSSDSMEEAMDKSIKLDESASHKVAALSKSVQSKDISPRQPELQEVRTAQKSNNRESRSPRVIRDEKLVTSEVNVGDSDLRATDLQSTASSPSKQEVVDKVLGRAVSSQLYDFESFDMDSEAGNSMVMATVPSVRSIVLETATADAISMMAPVNARNDSQPVSARKSSPPVSARNDSKPVSARNDPQPVNARHDSLPVSARKNSPPVSARNDSQPVSARNDSRPVSARKNSQPVSARNDSQPVSARNTSTPRMEATKALEEQQQAQAELLLHQLELEQRHHNYNQHLQPQFQAKDLVFISIIIEGECLEHSHYDTVQVVLEICGQSYMASVCLARERGSKRRSFNVNWGDIFVASESFKSESVSVAVVVTDAELLRTHPYLPCIGNIGNMSEQKHVVSIPLLLFMKSYFEVGATVQVPVEVDEDSDRIVRSGAVSITIHGHAHEAKEVRSHRIQGMKPLDLVSVKFDPLPTDSGDEEYSQDDDDYVVESTTATPATATATLGEEEEGVRMLRRGGEHTESQRELARSLFPKASHSNLLSAMDS